MQAAHKAAVKASYQTNVKTIYFHLEEIIKKIIAHKTKWTNKSVMHNLCDVRARRWMDGSINGRAGGRGWTWRAGSDLVCIDMYIDI